MLSIAIQAGGRSSRMGVDKALRPFLGRPLVERIIERLRPAAQELFITTNRPDEYAYLGLPAVPDRLPNRGALGGLLTAFSAAHGTLVGVAACDMPFASAELFLEAARLLEEEGADAVLARTPEGLEPLHAVYRREACLPAVEAAIQADQWRAVTWLPRVRVRYLTPVELRRWDPDGLAFVNVNTPEEFARAEALASADDQHRAGRV